MKHLKYILPLMLCLLLAACGPKSGENPPEASSLPAVSSQSGSTSPPAPDDPPAPDVSEPDVSAPGSSEPEPLVPLTREELAAAHQAALDYYTGTVFEVDTLTEIEPRQGEVAFRVSCSKGGVKVDPDRTISLERQDGVWTVVNEGY